MPIAGVKPINYTGRNSLPGLDAVKREGPATVMTIVEAKRC
jgi:hypothetical protein